MIVLLTALRDVQWRKWRFAGCGKQEPASGEVPVPYVS